MESPTQPRLVAGGNVRRRKLVNRGVEGVWMLATTIAVAVLGIVTVSVLLRGIRALDLDLFTKTQATFGEPGGDVGVALELADKKFAQGTVALRAAGEAIGGERVALALEAKRNHKVRVNMPR